ncbi:pyridoxal-phosphate dependent enzyme family/ornithine cyclodeaminase family protein [Pseudomonas syringae pv. actinidiae ICMP 18883]|uniref:2,3-diaminopropionate biosynthesis protein SbnA n=1 Tax=Pseudomonas syringae TaxID=317 RepID=UPI00035821BD|nr:2,3-diaminopropionate biosynthesis protein SbnA [Pseudomonas syringae]EPN31592.1 pyridoxal-phosphate dependent enzyme family/ornithine cyclodeaminase family protein [Pseudomonas syringae pv. actinidiae ICMP 18883]
MHKALGYESLGDIVHDQTFLKVTGVGPDFFLKMESLNPAGSIKLKTAVGLVNDVQARGLLGPQTTLIESSSGNLGVALAMICAERGIPFTCVVDPNSSSHNIRMMRSYGAQVIQVEIPDANGGFLGTRIALIREKVASDPRYVWLNQYENAANPRAHARTTAHSISRHFGHIDYLFVGAGTTGTLMGCLQHFQRHHPTTKIIAVDSVGSVTFGTPASRRFIPGLGTSQRPPIFNADGIHALEMVPEAHAVAMCRILARSKGMLVGGSTATVIAAVHAWRERIEPSAVVVALSPDWGERYLDTLYDDQWVEQRFGREVLSMTLADLSNSKNTPLCGRELARESGGSVVTPSRASSLPQDLSVSVRCLCADGGGNVVSSRAESPPAIPCGSELARESGGSVVMPSRASSLPQDVGASVRCLCADGDENVVSSRAESSPAIPCGSELARESGGSVVMPSRASSLPQGVGVMCVCADGGGNVVSSRAESLPAIPCGSELARESGGSVVTPSRASSLPQGVSVMCLCADGGGNVASSRAESLPAIPCGSELARESGGSVVMPSRASSLPQGVGVMCVCADGGGNVVSSRAESLPAIPCGSELARESAGSVVTPSRASSLPQGVGVSVMCVCADGGGKVASSRAESSPAIPCGSELARESAGSVVMPSRASLLPQDVGSSDEAEAERLTQAAFHVVDGEVTARLLAADPLACIDDVQAAYLAHEAGRTVNPDSYFLRFPEAPANRIIALPASLAGDQPVSGIKWISSFPGNVDTGLQRASAVLILNDPVTGYAFACLEASRISAMRTAASAVLGARWMNRQQRHVRRMAFIGAGFIARTLLDMFVSDGWAMGSVSVFDQHEDSALALISHAAGRHRLNGEQTDLHDCLQADVVVFATTAPSPYVLEPVFRPGQVVLNISLRDLGPEVIAQANNILDDVEHCLKAQTSPDLAVRQYQHRSFITGTLAQLMTGEVELSPERASIFSPFGLGVLDLAVGQRVYRQALAEGSALPVPRFFFESNRW